jgi:uncharacterized protein involved in outer membrane biogenesis
MKLRRFVGVFFGIVGVVLLAAVLYVSFGDLGCHKSRIEALVTRSIGRPFAIDGPLKRRLVPTVDVSAEHVRLGNVQGGSQPQMVEIERDDMIKLVLGSIEPALAARLEQLELELCG